MRFGVGELERLLLALFALSEEQRSALRARLKEFQRLGLLTSSGPPGGWADYSVETLLRIILIFELIDGRCSPVAARRMVETHWANLRVHWAFAWRECRARAAGEAPSPYLWAILPHGLQEIGAGDLDGVPVTDAAGEADLATFTRWAPHGPLGQARHVMLVNLPLLVQSCRQALARVSPQHEEFFCKGLEALALATENPRADDKRSSHRPRSARKAPI